MDAYATQLCSPSHSHTPLSFFPSVMLSFMSARNECTQETVTASPTLEEQQWVSALHRPGASSDAAFALKQFLRISSKNYTNENRRLDAFFGLFFVSGSVSLCVKVSSQIPASRIQSHSNTRPPSLTAIFLSCVPELTAVLAFLRHVEVRVDGLLQSFAHQRLLRSLFTLPEDHGAVHIFPVYSGPLHGNRRWAGYNGNIVRSKDKARLPESTA